MGRVLIVLAFCLIAWPSYSQERALHDFVSASFMTHASISLCVKDADSGATIIEYNPGQSLIPASVMKLITSGVALEMLGPDHYFSTVLGYTGSLNRRTGRLSGSIVIRGGGDPALGSPYFSDHYQDIAGSWLAGISSTGIKKITGSVITDDSYYDYLPVPATWLWEDMGNYYGAGVYGLSMFDNTEEIHMATHCDSSGVTITGLVPPGYSSVFTNRLLSLGASDEGYVFAAPYSDYGWLAGTVPSGREDFILKASIADPPLFAAGILTRKLEGAGIKVSGKPSTVRLQGTGVNGQIKVISEISSPPLSEIIEVLNHESVNLYAETLLKELGKVFRKDGTTASGSAVVTEFLQKAGIKTDGLFLEDGSGLSPRDAINSEALADYLIYMRNHGSYFQLFYNSLPEAGKNGTLRTCFRDPAFEGRLRAKSGSMSRVRCYAGYMTSISGNNLVFSVLVNNFSGTSQDVIAAIEVLMKEIILYK